LKSLKFSVHLNNSISTPKPTHSGHPQGAVLSTLFFPLSCWRTASSTHSSRLTRRRHCPSVSFLASWFYTPQTQVAL
jgi:hypothetical protein